MQITLVMKNTVMKNTLTSVKTTQQIAAMAKRWFFLIFFFDLIFCENRQRARATKKCSDAASKKQEAKVKKSAGSYEMEVLIFDWLRFPNSLIFTHKHKKKNVNPEYKRSYPEVLTLNCFSKD